jgi:hypothetical protein
MARFKMVLGALVMVALVLLTSAPAEARSLKQQTTEYLHCVKSHRMKFLAFCKPERDPSALDESTVDCNELCKGAIDAGQPGVDGCIRDCSTYYCGQLVEGLKPCNSCESRANRAAKWVCANPFPKEAIAGIP